MTSLDQRVVKTIQSVIGHEPATLHEPNFSGNEEKYVAECVRTGWVSSVGSFVDRFEMMLQEITGAKFAVAVSNGTSGLFIALKLAGVEPGDEVLVPALTFVATANAVCHCGATPHFVDIELDSLGVNPERLRDYLNECTRIVDGQRVNKQTNRKIAALVPVHAFGHPCQVTALMDVAHEFNLAIVEDAAESLGSRYENQHTGTLGRLGMISFNGNKICTTGGGGAILTNDQDLGRQAKHLTTTAKIPHAWKFHHDQVAFNFRMPNLNAALGCAQLEQLDSFVTLKRQLATSYEGAFRDCDQVNLLTEPKSARSNYWLNTLLLNDASSALRDQILETTNQAGIMTRAAWDLMPDLPMYSDCPRDELPNCRNAYLRILSLPSGIAVAERAAKKHAKEISCLP